MVKTKIAVMVSGGGTNLQALLDAQKSGVLTAGEIVLVIASNAKAYAITRAEQAGVPAVVCSRKELGSQEAFEAAISQALADHGVELIVLAGFMSILGENFTKQWPRRILNVHPSLIPSFCGQGFYGLKVHEAALAYGVKVTGATVHFVNEVPDGGEILLQKAVEVQPGDTPEILQKRVMEQAEWKLLPQATQMISEEIGKGKEPMNIYETLDLATLLAGNPYPGRGIIIGKTADGAKSVVAYFIMGRSENSRNRVFIKEPDGIRTEAHDPAKLADPSLIIYHPVRQVGRGLIVTNGDQTDTIREFIEKGLTFEQALRTREFEPDGPNWTPRISGLLSPDGSYKMSILKSADAEGSACARYTYEYPGLAGVGHFLHTYVTDGNPIPTFQGEPERVAITGTMEEFTNLVWNNLNEANKISLYVRFTDLATGEYEETIINKNQ